MNKYYFNFKLMCELPRLFRLPKSKLSQMSGLGVHGLTLWSKSAGMSVAKFVRFLNLHRLSMADFLVTSSSVPIRESKENYVIPEDQWAPIEWHNERLTKTYGEGSLTGIPSRDALAKLLGYSDHASVTRWVMDPETMKMSTLIDLLNNLKLDAKLFISDHNRYMDTPDWEIGKNEEGASVSIVMNEIKDLRSQIKERDSRILKMQQEIERLKRENNALRDVNRAGRSVPGIVSEQGHPAYGVQFQKPKIVFHRELWERLPEIFEMNGKTFRGIFGLRTNDMYSGNLKMDKLIDVCNKLHISITHFFPPSNEPLTVNNRSWYEISPRLFQPITDRFDNMRYIFKKETFGITRGQLMDSEGINHQRFVGFSKKNGHGRMILTILNICNSFNLPISVFVSDPNVRKRPAYSISLNETLMENCVEMNKELERCKERIRKLELKKKEPDSSVC